MFCLWQYVGDVHQLFTFVSLNCFLFISLPPVSGVCVAGKSGLIFPCHKIAGFLQIFIYVL